MSESRDEALQQARGVFADALSNDPALFVAYQKALAAMLYDLRYVPSRSLAKAASESVLWHLFGELG
jgi:hypothetical protein